MNYMVPKKTFFLTIIIGIIGIAIALNTLAWADPYADNIVKIFDGGDGFKGGWDINGNGLADPGEPINIPVNPTVACGAPDNWMVSILPNEYIIFEFTDNTIIDGPGNDLFVKEIGASGESARIFISTDGLSFTLLGTAYSGRISYFDFASIPGILCAPIRFVMIYDSVGGAIPGFDLDALGSTPGSTGSGGTDECIIDNVPLLKQCASPWGTDNYNHYYASVSADNDNDGKIDEDPKDDVDNDNDGKIDEDRADTICRWGCYLTSCAMIINYHGGNTDPRVLNNWLKTEPDGYIGSGLVNPSAVARYARNNGINLYYHGRVDIRNDSILDTYLCCEEPVIIKIGGHFVVATGKSDSTYRINDPGYNRNTIDNYAGIRKFSSTFKDLATLIIIGKSPIEFLITDPLGRKTGLNPITGEEFKEIPHADYFSEYITAADDSNESTPDVKIFELPYPFDGEYQVEIIGTDNGSYELDFIGYDEIGEPSIKTFSGMVTSGEIKNYIVNYASALGSQIEVIPPTNNSPIADAGYDQTVAADSDCMATVTLDGSGSSDPDSDPLTYAWTWDGGSANGVNRTIQLPLGTTTITLIVNDGALDSTPDTVDINVIDETPPEISLSVSPDTLWPPNHKMVLITPNITVIDNCDPDPIVEMTFITTNESDETNTYHPDYDATIGDGNTINDIQVDENGDIYLRAERSGTGSGRIYTITYNATDSSGNSSSAIATVTVPHDQQ